MIYHSKLRRIQPTLCVKHIENKLFTRCVHINQHVFYLQTDHHFMPPNICYDTPLGKYFNIELKSIVAQHENLARKGIFGVRAPFAISLLISFKQQ